jgi:hypothetical protein
MEVQLQSFFDNIATSFIVQTEFLQKISQASSFLVSWKVVLITTFLPLNGARFSKCEEVPCKKHFVEWLPTFEKHPLNAC